MNVIPIDALFNEELGPNESDDPREALQEAEVILAVDVMTQKEAVVFGKELLQEIASGKNAASVAMLRIGLDIETDELEKLLALVQVMKGYHDYR